MIREPLKPKKKKRVQSSRGPRLPLIKPPKISTPNHTIEEKNESAEQRLKLKIMSRLIEVRLTIRSETTVKRKKSPPKTKPATKFSTVKPKVNIDRTPACKDNRARYTVILF
jgi:hypothetical protein